MTATRQREPRHENSKPTKLERAAMWLYRASHRVDNAALLNPDDTCICEWCRARRNFIRVCSQRRVP